MKRLMFFGFTCLAMLVSIGSVSGQNFFKTDADKYKLLGDTTYATAAQVTFEPGQKTNVHTHAAQFLYALTDGVLTVHFSDGKTEVMELKTGDSFLAPPFGPHWTENTGKKPITFIVVEFNEHPYKEMKEMKMKK